jgi:hypothetical protein
MSYPVEPSARKRALLLLLVGAVAGLPGCSKKDSQAPDAGPRASAASSSANASVPPAGTQWPQRRGDSLAARMQQESASRATGTPTVEAVLAAFTKAGVSLHDVGQHLGSPIGAMFCNKANTDHGIIISVCEYESEQAAVAGNATSAKAFSMVPNRDLYVNKKTTLTLLQQPKSAASEAEAKNLMTIFMAL